MTVRLLLAAGEPKTEAELEELLKFYQERAEFFLRNSSLLDGLDWENESHQEEIYSRLTTDKDRREFFALKMLFSSEIVKEAFEESNARKAAWAMYQATMSNCFFEMGNYDFEETLWQGHQAHVFLTKVQDVSAQTPAQAQAIEKLKPLFERQAEITLHTWVEDEYPIKERIGVSELPEETLRAMAKYYLSLFERERQEIQRQKEDKRKEEESKRQEKALQISIGVACITSVMNLLAAILVVLMNKFIPSTSISPPTSSPTITQPTQHQNLSPSQKSSGQSPSIQKKL